MTFRTKLYKNLRNIFSIQLNIKELSLLTLKISCSVDRQFHFCVAEVKNHNATRIQLPGGLCNFVPFVVVSLLLYGCLYLYIYMFVHIYYL